MKKIKTTQGEYVIVDDEDYPYLNRFKWCDRKRYSDLKNVFLDSERVVTFVASYKGKSIYVSMGKFLVDNCDSKNFVILHKNNNVFDFRKENLFLKSLSYKKIREGKYIFTKKKPTSKYKGVWRLSQGTIGHTKVWRACIKKNKKEYFIGNFYKEKDAAIAYNEKAKELYGEFAYQNKI